MAVPTVSSKLEVYITTLGQRKSNFERVLQEQLLTVGVLGGWDVDDEYSQGLQKRKQMRARRVLIFNYITWAWRGIGNWFDNTNLSQCQLTVELFVST